MSFKTIMKNLRLDGCADANAVLNNNFCVMIDIFFIMGFSKISNVDYEMEMQLIQEGGVNTYCHELPKPRSALQKLVFEKGYGTRNILKCPGFLPFFNPKEYNYTRIVTDIVVFNREGNFNPILDIYNYTHSVVTKLEIDGLDASSNSVAIERLEIVHA